MTCCSAHWDLAAADYRKAIELGRGDRGVLALVADALAG